MKELYSTVHPPNIARQVLFVSGQPRVSGAGVGTTLFLCTLPSEYKFF